MIDGVELELGRSRRRVDPREESEVSVRLCWEQDDTFAAIDLNIPADRAAIFKPCMTEIYLRI